MRHMQSDKRLPGERTTQFSEDAIATKLASAGAPFIFFDVTSCFSTGADGIVQLTLEAIRHTLPPQGHVIDCVAVAHLRMGKTAAKHLRDSLSMLLDPPLAENAPTTSVRQ